MKVYLDTCSLQRPLDDKSQLRVLLEAEAVLGLLAWCEAGDLQLVASEVLRFEIERNPNQARQEYALEALASARLFVNLDSAIEERSRALLGLGFKPLDALHLAAAEAGQADFLCTTDDRFLKLARRLSGLRTRVVSPVELIEEIEQW